MVNEYSAKLINKMINKGWEFLLSYHHAHNCNKGDEGHEKIGWEADFTRKLKSGWWDNHVSGFSKLNPSLAIKRAYLNVKNNKKVGKRHGK